MRQFVLVHRDYIFFSNGGTVCIILRRNQGLGDSSKGHRPIFIKIEKRVQQLAAREVAACRYSVVLGKEPQRAVPDRPGRR